MTGMPLPHILCSCCCFAFLVLCPCLSCLLLCLSPLTACSSYSQSFVDCQVSICSPGRLADSTHRETLSVASQKALLGCTCTGLISSHQGMLIEPMLLLASLLDSAASECCHWISPFGLMIAADMGRGSCQSFSFVHDASSAVFYVSTFWHLLCAQVLPYCKQSIHSVEG